MWCWLARDSPIRAGLKTPANYRLLRQETGKKTELPLPHRIVAHVNAAFTLLSKCARYEVPDASAELARRMEQVGNFNKLQRAREQGFYAEAALNLARAQQAHQAARRRAGMDAGA